MKNFDDFNYMMAHHSTDAEIDQDEATWDGYKFKDRA